MFKGRFFEGRSGGAFYLRVGSVQTSCLGGTNRSISVCIDSVLPNHYCGTRRRFWLADSAGSRTSKIAAELPLKRCSAVGSTLILSAK